MAQDRAVKQARDEASSMRAHHEDSESQYSASTVENEPEPAPATDQEYRSEWEIRKTTETMQISEPKDEEGYKKYEGYEICDHSSYKQSDDGKLVCRCGAH